MPSYEMTVLFKLLPKEELFHAVKRTASAILSEGGILRKLDGLYVNSKMPFKMRAHGKGHRQGSAFLYTFDTPAESLPKLQVHYSYDIDIIRANVNLPNSPEDGPCTLEEELQPPMYRAPVQEILAKVERKKRVRFPLNTGLDYNPLP